MISSIKHILFPTDFSNCSKHALSHAVTLAQKTGAAITLLHVIEPPYDFVSRVQDDLGQLKEIVQEQLEKLVQELKSKNTRATLKIDKKVRTGMTVSEILEMAEAKNMDLIVLGSRGDTPTRKVLFGSVSTDVMLRSHIPVLAVPENAQNIDFKNILFATDFRAGDVEALQQLAGFAKPFGSAIHILHVATKNDFNTDLDFRGFKELIKEKVSYNKIKFTLLFNQNTIDGISEFSTVNPVSLLVMNRYKKSGLHVLIDTNHTKKMSLYSNVPLLMLIGERTQRSDSNSNEYAHSYKN